ncbi:FecCD family ABC transporter permease [Pararhodobacter sp.]|uniref:FecCD family ABC transporter permease n=1 Tax=Pararhodobacter sp. TaxID=2127056 RepID=UPI002FDE92DF
MTRARHRTGPAAGMLALVVAFAASLSLGDRAIPLTEVARALWSSDGSAAHLIVQSIRLPRSLMAVEIGAALGVAGALMQAMTRNPLADPGLLGINAGAGLFVLIAVSLLGVGSLQGLIWFALLGALAGSAATWGIAAAGGRAASPVTLTLAGIAVGAVLTGLATALALMDPEAFDRLRHWSAGSLGGARMQNVATALPFIASGLVLAALCARPLDALAMGDDLAVALGARIGLLRTLVILAVTLLAGAATAVAGPVAFIGLMAPHVVRWWTGPDQRRILAGSALVAPVLVLSADVLGRLVLTTGEVPVSIVTAFLGAPLLIALARRRGMLAP